MLFKKVEHQNFIEVQSNLVLSTSNKHKEVEVFFSELSFDVLLIEIGGC